MTDFTAQGGAGLTRWIDSVVNGLRNALDLSASADQRFQEYQRLHQMTDAELTQLGLKRDQIGQHVFQDILYC